MNDSHFSLSGWHFIDSNWANVFKDCSDSGIDSLLPEVLVNCDLHGYARIDANTMHALDMLFTKCHKDMKMPSIHSIVDMHLTYKKFVYASAQVLVISSNEMHSKYMYMSMTNDKFWICNLDDAFIKLMYVFDVSNIGGMVVKAGCYTAIDEIFKEPLHGIDS